MSKLGAWATERTSCAASLRLAAATESLRHNQLAAHRTQELEATSRLGELLSCLEALQQELMDATSRRGQLLAEQVVVEERMRAAQIRMPEVDMEKKAAATKKVRMWKGGGWHTRDGGWAIGLEPGQGQRGGRGIARGGVTYVLCGVRVRGRAQDWEATSGRTAEAGNGNRGVSQQLRERL